MHTNGSAYFVTHEAVFVLDLNVDANRNYEFLMSIIMFDCAYQPKVRSSRAVKDGIL